MKTCNEVTKLISISKYPTKTNTYFANPIKSSWFVFIYANSQSIKSNSCSLQCCSLCRMCDVIIRSVSSRKRGYLDIYNVFNTIKFKNTQSKLTLSVHILTTFDSSVTTKSTHFNDGSFKRSICFFTIASNAISGVNNPT